MNMRRLGVILAATIRLCLQSTNFALGTSEKEIQKAYTDLTSADHWRRAKTASDRLSALGETALPTVLKGAKHEKRMVGEYCYKILYSKFPKHKKSIQAIIDGLNDKDPRINYPCAFHLGEHRIRKGKKVLEA